MTRKKKILIVSPFILIALAIAATVYCNRQVAKAAEGKIYVDVQQVPHHHTGLLLGTGKYLSNGYVNLFYRYRIDAALQLLRSGKIDYLVISGDNSRKDYNEPQMMKDDLVAAGVDSNRIYLDYAGFRTFDSIIRLREIFSQDSAIIISQRFHNERALYIAQREAIKAVGYNARDVSGAGGTRTLLREKLARVKVFADYIFGTDPKFLGPKVAVP